MKKIILLAIMAFFILERGAFAANAEFVNLTMAENPAHSQTISWRSGEKNNSFVEYKDESGKIYACYPAVKYIIIDEKGLYIYTAQLNNLNAGESYEYQIKADGEVLAEGSFKTADGSGYVKFAVFGDSQSIDYSVWRDTLLAAVSHNENLNFIVNNGDLVDNGNTYSEWQRWFKGGDGIFSNLNIVPVVGNHETFAKDYAKTFSFTMPTAFTEQFALPQNGPQGLKEQAYSFDYNNLHIIVLDSQFVEESAFLKDALPRQLEWLKEDLANSDKPWKIAFIHKPLYHNRADIQGTDSRLQKIADELKKGGAAAVFTAHDHVLATSKKDNMVYMATGRSGTKTSPNKTAREWNDWYFNPLNEPVYTIVSIEKNSLTAKIYGRSGSLLYEWELCRAEEGAE